MNVEIENSSTDIHFEKLISIQKENAWYLENTKQ